MTMGPVSAPAFSIPSIPAGAQIAVNEINSAGGLNGHKVQLIVCNDQNNPNTAAQCAREAIKDKVAALVGGLEDYDHLIEPLLVQAGIPWVGLITPDDYTSSNLFLFGGEGVDAFSAIGMSLAQEGCKHIAVVVTAASGTQNVNAEQIQAGVHAGNSKVATTLTVPATAVDFAPTVAAARAAGADCIGSGASPAQTGPLMAAVNAGSPKLKVATAEGGAPPPLIAALGKAGNGLLATSGLLPPNSPEPTVQKLDQAMKASYPKIPLDTFAQIGYAAVQVVAAASKGLGDVTASSLMTAIPKLTNYDTGMGPVVNFSSAPVAAYPRLFTVKDYVYLAKDGVYGLAQPTPIDTSPALQLLGGK
jgi:branched-chain amino acid transport system substrate-binding protein